MKAEQFVRLNYYQSRICRVIAETEFHVCLDGFGVWEEWYNKTDTEKVDSSLVREVHIPAFQGFHFIGYELVAEWPELQRDDRAVMCLVGSERPSLMGCVGSNPTPSAKIYEQTL